jgi:hypothetical protein
MPGIVSWPATSRENVMVRRVPGLDAENSLILARH